MLAWAQGEKVQWRKRRNPEAKWEDQPEYAWDWNDWEYRIAPKPREGWVNIYPGKSLFETREQADEVAVSHRLECIRVREMLEGTP